MMPLHVPPQYGPSFGSHGASVDPSVLAKRSVMIWYMDLDLQLFVEPATAEPENERRREVRRHIDEGSMLQFCESKVSARSGLGD